MIRTFSTLIILLISPWVIGQDLQTSATITGLNGQVVVDAIGNVYCYKGVEIFKYDATGKQLSKFSSHEYGTISGLDVSDPLKPVIIFSAFHWAVVLDNNLVESLRFSIDFNEFPGTELICTAKGEGYWIFDRIQMRPVKLNSRLETILTGMPASFVWDSIGQPLSMSANGDWLVINCTKGSVIYDRYGSYFRHFNYTQGASLKSFGNRLYFQDEFGIKIVDIRTSENRHFPLSPELNTGQFYPCVAGIWLRKGDKMILLPY